MTLTAFLLHLKTHPDMPLVFILPDGGMIPAHFHITEVGHVKRSFMDCGGTRRVVESCLLQTWVASDVEHRLAAGTLAGIFDRAGDLFTDPDLPVEIEYEDFSVSQFPVTGLQPLEGVLAFRLGLKHTDCLAKEVCLPGSCGPASEADLLGCAPGCCC